MRIPGLGVVLGPRAGGQRGAGSAVRRFNGSVLRGFRWTDYIPLGRRIPGTRFIAFKVPLKRVSAGRCHGLGGVESGCGEASLCGESVSEFLQKRKRVSVGCFVVCFW